MSIMILIKSTATWRNGYAEDCKSFYPSSILGVASKKISCFILLKKISCFILLKKVCSLLFLGSSVGRAVDC